MQINIVPMERDMWNWEKYQKNALASYPVYCHDTIQEAFTAANSRNYNDALKLCSQLPHVQDDSAIQMLQGMCNIYRGDYPEGKRLFTALTEKFPEEKDYRIYLGLSDFLVFQIDDALKDFRRCFPPEEFNGDYYATYGEVLLVKGNVKQAREMFCRVVDYWHSTGDIRWLDPIEWSFTRILCLDVSVGRKKFEEDEELFFDFLDQVEMTTDRQYTLAMHVAALSELMEDNKWFRPIFMNFVERIREKGFLSEFEGTLDSAYPAMEYYESQDDNRLSSVMSKYLMFQTETQDMEDPDSMREETADMKAMAVAYKWFMCQYLPGHVEELEYVKDRYPHMYKIHEPFFQEVLDDPRGEADRILEELGPLGLSGPKKQVEDFLYGVYGDALKDTRKVGFTTLGTYRRNQPKVGRNDPCPCGSGKKYKNCCGR